MTIHWQALGRSIFLVSADHCRPILYAPLHGVLLEVNRSYLERFREVLKGNTEAGRALGLEPSTIERFVQTPPAIERRLDPPWPSTFEPTSVTLFLTHKCTLRCAYCYCQGGEGGDMPWPVLERAVRFTLENARRQKRDLKISFHGGDVGARWRLFRDCVAFVERLCAEASVKPVLSIGTNGYYSKEQAGYVARRVNSATVSMDGIPDVHDAYRTTAGGRPSLARVLDTTGVFDASSISYSVRMTVTARSCSVLPECVDFICRNTQVETIRAEPLYCRGRAASSGLESPDASQFVEAFRAAREVAKSHRRCLSYSGARVSGVRPWFCSNPAPILGVTPEGNLTSCYEVLRPDDPLRDPFFYGHIPSDGSSVVVDEERVTAIREWARQRREACARCFCVSTCAGDCAAKVMDGALPEGEIAERCHITRSLVYDMLQAVLAGESPQQAVARPRIPDQEGCCDQCG